MNSTPPLKPLKSALRADDDASARDGAVAPTKAVSIAEPEPMETEAQSIAEEPQIRKQFSTGISNRRLSGRPALSSHSSSRTSIASMLSHRSESVPQSAITGSSMTTTEASEATTLETPHRHRIDRASEKLVAQLADWLHRERAKIELKKPRKHHLRKSSKTHSKDHQGLESPPPTQHDETAVPEPSGALKRQASVDSIASQVSLDRLQRILDDSMAALGIESLPKLGPDSRRPSLVRKRGLSSRSSGQLNRPSSDTDYHDGDVIVPSCDVVLDNTRVDKYNRPRGEEDAETASRRQRKERQAWTGFKNEILKLTHTLRLKGWRRVPLEGGGEDISVDRLSGALTNAVYVVTPPAGAAAKAKKDGRAAPAKLLLRIYGPQAGDLIDRDTELGILRRLARQKIGPRLLGTFENGRFEEFFNAETLTPADLRNRDCSRQIAKRMRELHEGIDLTEEERIGGASVLNYWDSWLAQVEKRMKFYDTDAAASVKPARHICGIEWPKFLQLVKAYQQIVVKYYGNMNVIRDKLVFAHNDTQYGNILRVRPDNDQSPLLVPENQHRQLIVIDFEYAAANMVGLEFANHFTEWTYNYHDKTRPWACNAPAYPTPEQQEFFVRAYVDHRPKTFSNVNGDDQTPVGTPLAKPQLPSSASLTSIKEFMLDARTPAGGWKEEEKKESRIKEDKIKQLLEETRLWRGLNSAQWVAWGIVQAPPLPGVDALEGNGNGNGGGEMADGLDLVEVDAATITTAADHETIEERQKEDKEVGEEAEAAFDYLAYTYERALFFLGDCVGMGILRLEDLPEETRDKVKIVAY